MRTLNRPMFRMGGPIKEGVMHGIRENYKRAGLVGDPVYPQTNGREHHSRVSAASKLPIVGGILQKTKGWMPRAWDKIKGWTGTTAQHQPITQVTKQPVTKWSKGYHGTVPGGSSFQPSGPIQKVWTPSGWVARDPAYQIGKKIQEGSGWIGKPIRWAGGQIATPTGALGLMYVGGQWLKSDGTPATDAEVESQFNFKGGTKPGEGRKEGMYYADPEKAKKLAEQRKDERVNKLLKTMGYDTAKRGAIGKALIDASQIVTERGTLNPTNITRELINPIIAATSKRLEKPEQLNEAVRLMLTKAEIEKEMNPGSPTLQTAKDMVNTGAAKNIQDAMKKLTKQSTMADTLAAIKSKGNTIGADEIEIAYRQENPDVIPNKKIRGSHKKYKEWKNNNKGKTEMDFMEEVVSKSDEFRPGVYVIDTRVIVVDEQGNMAYEW